MAWLARCAASAGRFRVPYGEVLNARRRPLSASANERSTNTAYSYLQSS